MSGLCQGNPTEMRSLLSPDQQRLQQALITRLLGTMDRRGLLYQGATPYPGSVAVGPDPSKLMAMNILMGMQGQKYTPPTFYPGIYGGGRTGGNEETEDDGTKSRIRRKERDTDGETGGEETRRRHDIITPGQLRRGGGTRRKYETITPGQLRRKKPGAGS